MRRTRLLVLSAALFSASLLACTSLTAPPSVSGNEVMIPDPDSTLVQPEGADMLLRRR